jgi:Domain of unknown function (DUF4214)
MMLRKTVILIPFFLFAFFLPSISSGINVDAVEKFLVIDGKSGQNDVQPGCIQEYSTGGYLVAGYTSLNSSSAADMLIQKYTSSGLLEWSKTAGGDLNDFAYYIRETMDGGIAVVGSTQSYGVGDYDIVLLKLNSQGNLLWSQTIGGALYDCPRSLEITPDGGFIIGGHTESYGAGGSDFLLIKCNSLGNVEWAKTFGGGGDERAREVRLTQDGGYITVGTTTSYGTVGTINGHPSPNVFIVKCDGSGNVQWTKTIGGSEQDDAYSVVPMSDGNYMVFGYTFPSNGSNSGFSLIKLNNIGNPYFLKYIQGSSSIGRGTIQQTSDGGFVASSGGYPPSSGAPVPFIFKFDSSANLEYTKFLKLSDENYYFTGSANSIIQTKDGGFALSGFLKDGVGSQSILLMKTDSNMDIDCSYFESAAPVSNTIQPISSSNMPNVGVINPTVRSQSVAISNYVASQSFLCSFNRDQIEAFVSRFYQVVLGRSAEADGLVYWSNSLMNKTRAGADVAWGFIFSQEFMNKNLDHTSFLNVLYSAFFNRQPDSGGHSYWLAKLNSGETRQNILNGFIYSQEFSNLCLAYSIMAVK